ncbi:MAG TPA: hypothetical protein VM695_08970, partial [Phycisphaerae bacterium]|nr:hypothetical protein [Phycisphaerae bacterium]
AMYLREEFVCDGNALVHAYPELGLAARRTEAALRVRALRRLVPHLLPPAKDLARGFDVRLEKAEGDLATIRLTPHVAGGEKPAAKLAVLITFDKRGFIHRQQWQVDGEVRLACTVSYTDSRVEIAWRAGEKEVGKAAYACEITQPQEDPFAAPTKGMVVLDMPLRRPEHYQALLKEIEADADKAPERLGLRRHLAFAQLQEHSWQVPWGKVEPAYQTLLAGLQEAAKAKLAAGSLGDLAILASAGHAASIRNQADELGLPSGDPLWAYWRNCQNFGELEKLAESQKGTFAGHLAAFVRTYQGGNDRPDRARQLMREYPDSALLPAAAIACGGNEDVWLELAGNRRWRLTALLGAAQYKQKPTAKIGEAFEACCQELSDAGWEVPISSRMVAALRTDEARWQRVVKRALAAAMESKDPGRLLRFAELAWPHGEKELAETALAAAAEMVEPKLTLTWKLTLTQSLTAMGRTQEAWELNMQVLKALEERGLSPSPALLAATARLAQRVGQSDLAVEYERKAIEAEKPHMPRRINVQLFRHRYQWLWEQLDQRVRQVAAAARSAPGDAEKQRLLDEALAAAKDVWETWKRVDTGNDADLYLRLGTLYRHAGSGQQAWRAVSSVIDENPREGSSYYHVGRWYVGHGDREAGGGWYARAYEVEPTNGDWAWHRAELLRQMGRKDEARALYEEIAAKKWQRRFEHYNAQAREALKKL